MRNPFIDYSTGQLDLVIFLLRVRAWLGGRLYRLGFIKRTTEFRWEIDVVVYP